MNIIEATRLARSEDKPMKRRSWKYDWQVKPTDICFEVLSAYNENKKRHPFWNPQTDDVLADDWILAD